jgi:hypothetical protein
MVYERTRVISLPITNQTTNTYDIYAEQPIDGRITKIQWNHPGPAIGPSGAGSCYIMVSGTSGTVYGVPEQILYINNVFGSSWRKYPLTYCSDNTGNGPTGGSILTEFVCRDSVLRIVGSGMALGTGSNSGVFKIHYY